MSIMEADGETLKWLWDRVYTSTDKDKIIEAVAARGGDETLIWLWDRVYTSTDKDKIIEAVAARGGDETLIWLWDRVYTSTDKDKIMNALNVSRINQKNRVKQKHNKSNILEGKNTMISKNTMINPIKFDVFICHASEDKESFVKALAVKLTDKGLNVWYDEFTLTLGDSLRRSIDQGLASSRYGVVVLSKKFFEKEWPQKELDGLIARENGSGKIILPIWHDVTAEEVSSFSPILAGKVAVKSDKGLDYVVNEIYKVFKNNNA